MAEARQTIAVIITFRKSNKKSLVRRAGGYLSSRGKSTPCTFSFLMTIINYNAQFEKENNIIRVLKL